METPPPFQPTVCPGAPKKKRTRVLVADTDDRPSKAPSRLALLRRVRDQLCEVSACHKQQLLRHVAPFVAEVVFLYYCDWFNKQPDEQFSEILGQFPGLDAEVEELAMSLWPDMTVASWERHLQRADKSCVYKVTLAEQFVKILISRSPARKALCFDDCVY